MTDPENRKDYSFLTNCIFAMDFLLILNFWFMNYHAIVWNKTNPYTNKMNPNLTIEQPINFKNVLASSVTYIDSYKLAFGYSFLILLRPYRFLNDIANGFDPNSRLFSTFKFTYTEYTQQQKQFYRQI